MSRTHERMAMPTYLAGTEFAVGRLMDAVWYEHGEFERARGFVREEVDEPTWNAFVSASLSEDEDTFWATYSGPGLTQLSANNVLAVRATTHELAAAALAGALLQIAKQGISTVHGKTRVSRGRLIGSQSLSVVIWEARNQAMHWELHDPFPAVQKVFKKLAEEKPEFGEYVIRSMAFDVIKELGWRTVEAFNEDLSSLA